MHGLLVSAGSRPGRGQCLFLGQDSTLQGRCIKGNEADLMRGKSHDGLASHPSGCRNTPGRFILQRL